MTSSSLSIRHVEKMKLPCNCLCPIKELSSPSSEIFLVGCYCHTPQSEDRKQAGYSGALTLISANGKESDSSSSPFKQLLQHDCPRFGVFDLAPLTSGVDVYDAWFSTCYTDETEAEQLLLEAKDVQFVLMSCTDGHARILKVRPYSIEIVLDIPLSDEMLTSSICLTSGAKALTIVSTAHLGTLNYVEISFTGDSGCQHTPAVFEIVSSFQINSHEFDAWCIALAHTSYSISVGRDPLMVWTGGDDGFIKLWDLTGWVTKKEQITEQMKYEEDSLSPIFKKRFDAGIVTIVPIEVKRSANHQILSNIPSSSSDSFHRLLCVGSYDEHFRLYDLGHSETATPSLIQIFKKGPEIERHCEGGVWRCRWVSSALSNNSRHSSFKTILYASICGEESSVQPIQLECFIAAMQRGACKLTVKCNINILSGILEDMDLSEEVNGKCLFFHEKIINANPVSENDDLTITEAVEGKEKRPLIYDVLPINVFDTIGRSIQNAVVTCSFYDCDVTLWS